MTEVWQGPTPHVHFREVSALTRWRELKYLIWTSFGFYFCGPKKNCENIPAMLTILRFSNHLVWKEKPKMNKCENRHIS